MLPQYRGDLERNRGVTYKRIRNRVLMELRQMMRQEVTVVRAAGCASVCLFLVVVYYLMGGAPTVAPEPPVTIQAPPQSPPPPPPVQEVVEEVVTIVRPDDAPPPEKPAETVNAEAPRDQVAEPPRDTHEPTLINQKRQQAVKEAFMHAWKGYETYAFGHDELKPVSNSSNDSWGGFAATLIDGIDTMIIMGLDAPFQKCKEFVRNMSFDKNHDASFFEWTIRYLGGLLSAYELSREQVFLDRAIDLGERLLPAFNSETGIPYHEVNLQTGAVKNPSWNQRQSILAELGSVQLEFKYLAAKSGRQEFFDKAQKVMDVLDKMNPADGLFPVYINPQTATGNDHLSYGALGDSFYEYLLKQWLQTQKRDSQFRRMYDASNDGMIKRLVKRSVPGNMTYLAEWENGRAVSKMDHLVCYVPGMLALGAEGVNKERDLELARDLMETCAKLYQATATGIGPEIVRFDNLRTHDYNIESAKYHLRPETLESLFVMYRITHDEKYREWAWSIFEAIERYCRTPIAYSGLIDVTRAEAGPNQSDSMQSFFLAETLKYLFLIFGDDDVIPLDKYVFTTEAHPLGMI